MQVKASDISDIITNKVGPKGREQFARGDGDRMKGNRC
jgi:hypothetical protein